MTTPVVFRPVRKDDSDSVWLLLNAGRRDTVGMTSLPASHDEAVSRCESSERVVRQLATGEFSLDDGESATVLMGAFEPDSGQALGTAGMTFKQAVPNLAVQVTTSVDGLGLTMRSSSDPWTRTELNAIYLGERGRGRRLGTVLSRGRFLFLHLVRSKTPETVAAHMRGRFNDDGVAPFWDCFGAHFSSWADSLEAEQVLAAHPERVDELTNLTLPLTPRDLESLGLVNRASLSAFGMLIDEGLRSNGLYDPVDGGPTVSGQLVDTRTSRERVHGHVVIGEGGEVDALVSVTSVANFAVVRTQIAFDAQERVHLTDGAAKSLGVSDDSLVTVLPLGER